MLLLRLSPVLIRWVVLVGSVRRFSKVVAIKVLVRLALLVTLVNERLPPVPSSKTVLVRLR